MQADTARCQLGMWVGCTQVECGKTGTGHGAWDGMGDSIVVQDACTVPSLGWVGDCSTMKCTGRGCRKMKFEFSVLAGLRLAPPVQAAGRS